MATHDILTSCRARQTIMDDYPQIQDCTWYNGKGDCNGGESAKLNKGNTQYIPHTPAPSRKQCSHLNPNRIPQKPVRTMRKPLS